MKKLKTMKQEILIISNNSTKMSYNEWIKYIYEQVKLIKNK